MAEPSKPFVCCMTDCGMTFTNEDHLNIHTKKHDMILQLGQKASAFVADQTPTPTRFIRNCEEVGLFQDLQNVNPFDETFKRAMDTKSSIALSLDSTLSGILSDDALHTPTIFSQENSPNTIFKAGQGATDLRTNLSINRSSCDESAVIVKSLSSPNAKTLQSDILTTIKSVETQNLPLESSSNVTISRQDSLELVQSVLEGNITKKVDILNNVEVKFHSNLEIRHSLQDSGTDTRVDSDETNLVNIGKSVQIPSISITDSSTGEIQDNTNSIVMKNDVMLTATSKSELNVTDHIKKNCVGLISQKSLDMAIDSLTSDCLKRIDSFEENVERIDKPIESHDLITKIKSNLQSVLHNAIEKHALDKIRNKSSSTKQNVEGNRNKMQDTHKMNMMKRKSQSSDETMKYERKKPRTNDSDCEYEITLKLPNGKKVLMKSVDMIKKENARSPDLDASSSGDSELSIEYCDMSNTKQKLKDAINMKKCNDDNSQQSLLIARDKTALEKLYTNASKGIFSENFKTTQDLDEPITIVACTTTQKNNIPNVTYILPGNIIPVVVSSSNSPPNVQLLPISSPSNTNPSSSPNANRNKVVINNTQIATKSNANTQLLPHITTNTNTVLQSNNTKLNSNTQLLSHIIANTNTVLQSNKSKLNANTQLVPHIMTNTNTVLQSDNTKFNANTQLLPDILTNTNTVLQSYNTKLNANTQLLPHIIANTNTVLQFNNTKLDANTQLYPDIMTNTNTVLQSNNTKLNANTQLLPHIMTNPNTVLQSNKTKLNANTQLLPNILRNTNTVLQSNKSSISPSKTTLQSTSSNNIIRNVFLIKSNQNSTKLDVPPLIPHTMTNTKSELTSNKPAAINKSIQSNDFSENIIVVNNPQITTESHTIPHTMTNTKTELTSNKPAAINKSIQSNNFSENIIFVNNQQITTESHTIPHTMTNTETVSTANKLAAINKSIQSNDFSENIIFVNNPQITTESHTIPHTMTNTKTVLTSNKPMAINKSNYFTGNVIFVDNQQITTKSDTIPQTMTNTKTVLTANKPAAINQSIQSKHVPENVIFVNNQDITTKSDTIPHTMTITKTVLTSNKPAAINKSNNVTRNVIFVNNQPITRKLDTKKHPSPNILAYTNNVLSTNIMPTTYVDKTSESNCGKVICIDVEGNLNKIPHLITCKNTVLPSNKINTHDDISKSMNKIGIPLSKEHCEMKMKNRTSELLQKKSRQESQNAAVKRYRKRQSELKRNLLKKNAELKSQNDRLSRDLATARQEIVLLRGLLENNKNSTL